MQTQIEHELQLIRELEYEAYFLTAYDIVRFTRSQHILCQGRGAAANSAVCYCFGVTEVDPARGNMLFERFISKERGEPPDIDVGDLRFHEYDNLFCCDNSIAPHIATANPSLTLAALALRLAKHLASDFTR